MINPLPYWNLTDIKPAFHDVESLTAVQMIARIYPKIQEIVTDYNKFVTETNKVIEEYTSSIKCSQDEFECRITKVIHDYIDFMDTKYAEQDKEVKDAITYMKDNLSSEITKLVAEMKEMGELDQAILDAIDGIGSRVATLDIENTNIKGRLETIENTKTYLNYNSDTKELDLIIDERIGE